MSPLYLIRRHGGRAGGSPIRRVNVCPEGFLPLGQEIPGPLGWSDWTTYRECLPDPQRRKTR
jgi:hypothetical protein